METKVLTACNTMSLKEWAVIVKAMDMGKQIMLLRKGGIRDEQGQINLEHKEFFLFPTYEHQREEFLKPEYLGLYQKVLDAEGAFDKIRFTNYASLEKVYIIEDTQKLYDLEAEYLWSPAYVKLRVNYKPDIPLYLMFLRVYRLPEPVEAEALIEYEGCKSWVDLKQPVSTQGVVPVLAAAEFEARMQAIEKVLKS